MGTDGSIGGMQGPRHHLLLESNICGATERTTEGGENSSHLLQRTKEICLFIDFVGALIKSIIFCSIIECLEFGGGKALGLTTEARPRN